MSDSAVFSVGSGANVFQKYLTKYKAYIVIFKSLKVLTDKLGSIKKGSHTLNIKAK